MPNKILGYSHIFSHSSRNPVCIFHFKCHKTKVVTYSHGRQEKSPHQGIFAASALGFTVEISYFLDVFMGDELCEGPRVGHCIGGEELTLGQGRRGEGLTLSRGGTVNAKFEAHIMLHRARS